MIPFSRPDLFALGGNEKNVDQRWSAFFLVLFLSRSLGIEALLPAVKAVHSPAGESNGALFQDHSITGSASPRRSFQGAISTPETRRGVWR